MHHFLIKTTKPLQTQHVSLFFLEKRTTKKLEKRTTKTKRMGW